MNLKLKIIAYLTVIFTVGISVNAETLDLNLSKAREIALQNNPGIKLAREAISKSKASINEARGNLLPTISGFSQFQHAWELPTFVLNFPDSTGQIKVMKLKMGQENTMVYGLNLSQPLYVGGALWNGYQMSKIAGVMTEAQYKATEQKILSDVTSAYYGLLYTRSSVDVSEEGLHSAEQNLKQVQKFFDVGKSSRFDVLRAEVQVANFKPMVVSAKNYTMLAESNLRMILGVDDKVEFVITDQLQYVETDLLNMSVDEFIEIALRDRPEILIASQQKNLAKKQLSLSKASYMPSLVVGTTYQYQGQREDFRFVKDDFYKSFNSSLSLSFPIFNGFKTSAKVQQAKIEIKESGYQEESLVNGIKMEIKSAYFTMKQAHENVLTQQVTIEQAKEASRLAELMYTEGAVTQLDVLNANVALNQAKINYQKSLYEYNVALANLKKAINQL